MKWFRFRLLWTSVGFVALFIVLVIGDQLCYTLALPVTIDIQNGVGTLSVGSQRVTLGKVIAPTSLQFAPHDPVIHEYQIDGTDSTNNQSLDTNYLHDISASPYYQFQSWMRDLDSTSHWRDVEVVTDGHIVTSIAWPENGTSLALPTSSSIHIHALLQRPETAVTLNLRTQQQEVLHITLDRNNRQISITKDVQGQGDNLPVSTIFFPLDVVPFAAMVLDTVLRTTLGACLVLLFVTLSEAGIAIIRISVRRHSKRSPYPGNMFTEDRQSGDDGEVWDSDGHGLTWEINEPGRSKLTPLRYKTIHSKQTSRGVSLLRPTKLPILGASLALNDSNASYPVQENPTKKVGLFQQWWLRLNKSLHPVALLALSGSLCFTAWIAAVQYHGEPHIFDASAYLFQAKMYALGRISVPVPPAVDLFPGPFMVQNNGQWFGQYAPGTGLALVPGLWLGVPWLVEPIMGTLALLGIGLIAARLYDRKVATLAVLLGTLSPFYSYLAASYLSHTVELFYLVWGLWAVLRFAQGEENWNMLLAGICFGMASLTRDEVTLLFMTIMLSGVILLYHRAVWQERGRWFLFGLLFLCLMVLFTALSWRFNQLLTGSVWVTPRSLFFAGDHWGFGPGVGFYGQHTLAAGLVNLDELLTILAIDLYGWPFYFSLLFPVIPFLTGKVKRADWLLLAGAVIMTSAYVGYFYHGIYLGPRYLFETLPFLLILTARGIFTLAGLGQEAGQLAGTWLKPCRKLTVVVPRPRTSIVTIALVLALVACNLVYYLPRQVDLHRDYTGLPAGYNINLENVYHPTLHRAIVVTDDANIYQFVLFPLNDPLLHGDVLYAYASTPADYAELRAKLPGRTLYYLQLQPDGNVKYLALQP